jgi:hypothetical protein
MPILTTLSPEASCFAPANTPKDPNDTLADSQSIKPLINRTFFFKNIVLPPQNNLP